MSKTCLNIFYEILFLYSKVFFVSNVIYIHVYLKERKSFQVHFIPDSLVFNVTESLCDTKHLMKQRQCDTKYPLNRETM